jgi:hypothetical protein
LPPSRLAKLLSGYLLYGGKAGVPKILQMHRTSTPPTNRQGAMIIMSEFSERVEKLSDRFKEIDRLTKKDDR